MPVTWVSLHKRKIKQLQLLIIILTVSFSLPVSYFVGKFLFYAYSFKWSYNKIDLYNCGICNCRVVSLHLTHAKFLKALVTTHFSTFKKLTSKQQILKAGFQNVMKQFYRIWNKIERKVKKAFKKRKRKCLLVTRFWLRVIQKFTAFRVCLHGER